MVRRLAALLAVSALLVAACGGGASFPDGSFGVVASSDLGVGQHRVAVVVVGPDNEPLLTPDVEADFEFFRPDGSPAGTVPAEFIWAIENVQGRLVADFTFDEPGAWQLGVRPTGGDIVRAGPFAVNEQAISVDVGDQAPASETKTSASGPIGTISTDVAPDPRFYGMTVAEAVTSGRPSVVVFATPAFCVSATCGPALDVAKAMADDFPRVNWVHVEVYDNLDAQSFDELVEVPAVNEWDLFSEPWVYVVDGSGVVSARFDGAVGDAELRRAVEAVAG
jgi:hypothetical protein